MYKETVDCYWAKIKRHRPQATHTHNKQQPRYQIQTWLFSCKGVIKFSRDFQRIKLDI